MTIGIEGTEVGPDDVRGVLAVDARMDDGRPDTEAAIADLVLWSRRDRAAHQHWWQAVLRYRRRMAQARSSFELDKLEQESKAFIHGTGGQTVFSFCGEQMQEARVRVRKIELIAHKQAKAGAEAKEAQEHILKIEGEYQAKRQKEIDVVAFLDKKQPGMVRGTASFAFSGLSERVQKHVARCVVLGESPEGLDPTARQWVQELTLVQEQA